MSSQPSGRRPSVSFLEGHTIHILSPRVSPEPVLEDRPPATNGGQQAGAYRIPVVNHYPPRFFAPGPAVQPSLTSFPVPPTPLLSTIELPPAPSLPTGTISSVPTALGADELALLPSKPIAWRLQQQWDVRDMGLPIGLPADDPIPALSGVPEVALHFIPHPSFSPFVHTIVVQPNFEGKFVVTVGDLAREIKAALRTPLQGRISDEQRAVLQAAQRSRHVGRGSAPADYRVDMWGPGRMFLRHLVSLSAAEEGLRREFAVQFQLI